MRTSVLKIRTISVATLFGVMVAVGCSSGTTGVEGTVKYQGKAVEGAMVVFYSPDGTQIGSGMSDSTGKFKMATQQGKTSIPHGTYSVVVSKTSSSGINLPQPGEQIKMDKEMIMKMKNASKDAGKSALPQKFADPKTTTLTVTIPHSGSLEFDLDK